MAASSASPLFIPPALISRCFQLSENEKVLTIAYEKKICKKRMQDIIVFISTNSNICTLDVGRNKINESGFQIFIDFLKATTQLTELKLGDIEILPKQLCRLSEAFEHSKSIKSFHAHFSRIGNSGTKTLSKYAQTLTQLTLKNADIDDYGCTELMKYIDLNQTITHLDLSCNKITRIGCKIIMKFARKTKTLASLNINFNPIGHVGIFYAIEMLEKNTSLKRFETYQLDICDHHVFRLVEILKTGKNTTLEYINFGQTFESAGYFSIESLLFFRINITFEHHDFIVSKIDSIKKKNNRNNRWPDDDDAYSDFL